MHAFIGFTDASQETLFRWLARSDDVKLETQDSSETDISEYVYLPDVHSMSETLRSCLQVTLIAVCAMLPSSMLNV